MKLDRLKKFITSVVKAKVPKAILLKAIANQQMSDGPKLIHPEHLEINSDGNWNWVDNDKNQDRPLEPDKDGAELVRVQGRRLTDHDMEQESDLRERLEKLRTEHAIAIEDENNFYDNLTDHDINILQSTRFPILLLFAVIGEIGALTWLISGFIMGEELSMLLKSGSWFRLLIVFSVAIGFFRLLTFLSQYAFDFEEEQFKIRSVPHFTVLLLLAILTSSMREILIFDSENFHYVILTILFITAIITGVSLATAWYEHLLKRRRTLYAKEQHLQERITDLEEKISGWEDRIYQIIQKFTNAYQQSQNTFSVKRDEWETFKRNIEQILTQVSLQYDIYLNNPHQTFEEKFSKFMLRIKNSSVLIPIAILVAALIASLFSFNCTSTSQKEKIEDLHMQLIVDRSSSAGAASFSEEDGLSCFNLWLDTVENSYYNGSFDIVLIGRNFTTTQVIFHSNYPKKWERPVSVSKRKWRKEVISLLKKKLQSLPITKGSASAIIESIFRSCDRLSVKKGNKVIIIFSDMRQVTPEFWNFERRIPNPDKFIQWVDNQKLRPALEDIDQVIICGFHPLVLAEDVAVLTSVDFSKMRDLWSTAFLTWGKEVLICEDCCLDQLEISKDGGSPWQGITW